MTHKFLQFILSVLVLALPLSTTWIYRELVINGGKWQYGTLQYKFTEGLFFLAVLAGLVIMLGHLRKKHGGLSLSPDRMFVLAGALLVLWGYISVLWAPDKELAFQHALHVLEAFVLIFLFLLAGLQYTRLFYLLGFVLLIQGMIGLVQFGLQYVAASSLLGMAEHLASDAGASVVTGDVIGRILRAYGTFPHPNVLGGFFAIGMVLFSWLHAQERRDKYQHWFSWLVMIISGIGLYVSFSRTAWIAALVGCAIIWWKEKGSRQMLHVGFASLIAMAFLLMPITVTRIAGSSVHQQRSVTDRVELVEQSTSIIYDAPFHGVGVGNYTAAVIQKHAEEPGWAYQPVHMVPVLLFAELGVIGVLLALLTLHGYLRLLRWKASQRGQYLAVSILSVLLVISLLDHYLWTQVNMMFLTALALSLPLWKIHKSSLDK